ncbi:structure-specific endonuclease subunit SLX4 [Heteronotia binoei]|uniref:structure-specific endonuclease subunit SLX4 n=1 Tax=Heteronotia binoei TaxID=13085 RepID=UPI002930CBE7|nr:structure-specific endonuclease subunit SLX4 [Heteronotia binoei]
MRRGAEEDEEDFREGQAGGRGRGGPPMRGEGEEQQQPPRAPPPGPSRLKRKGSSGTEQPSKKPKSLRARAGAAQVEELLVALAMSRSLHEEEEEAKAQLQRRQNRAQRQDGRRRNPRAEKKTRAMPPRSPPTLLLQDPEKARREMEERVALLLSEVDEFPSTPPLPPSRLLASELPRKVGWPGASPLWERSSLVGPPAPGLICVAALARPALPGQVDQAALGAAEQAFSDGHPNQSDKSHKPRFEPNKLVRPSQSTALPLWGSIRPEAEETLPPGRACGRSPQGQEEEGGSPQEGGALQDLMELAGEGLTLTQWGPAAQQGEEPGQEWVPGDVPWSCLDQSLEKKLPLGSCRCPPVLLGLLAAAFKGMVNNPHLSDVQFQVGSGELFYAHMFVLYARCPQLMEVVDQQGFWVAEDGEAKTRRVLLGDVSGEAARVFFSYLYTAEHLIPPDVRPDVLTLAMRFGVAELAALCTSPCWSGQPAAAASAQEEEEEERLEKFEELLKSLWVGEEEEDKAVLPEEDGVNEQELEEIHEFATTQQREAEEARRSRGSQGAGPGEPSGGKRGGLDAREEEALPDEKSLLAGSWGESLELFRQEPGEEAAVVKSSTPLGLPPLSPNTSLGGSRVPLGVLAEKLPASPQGRGGFCGDLSLALFSPAPPEACQGQEQDLPARGTDSIGCGPAPVELLLDPEEEEAAMGAPSQEREAVAASQGRGPSDGSLAAHALASGPRAAPDGHCTQPSAVILQGWLPPGHRSPPWRPSARLPRATEAAADVVVILDDSEEEAEVAPRLSWGSSVQQAELPILEESHGQRLDLGGGGSEAELLPLPRRLPVPVPLPRTPDLVCPEREAPPTLTPSYSTMGTPVLKKELSRFGVRALPKQQMVLKLKEIFHYTHQRSGSRAVACASSQRGLCRGTQAARRGPTFPAAAHSGCTELLQGRAAGSCAGAGVPGQGPRAKRGCLRKRTAAEAPVRHGLSGTASHTPAILQSSSSALETSVLAEEEEEDDIPTSQSARREADMSVALRQYLHSRPALCRQILLYQPFELARLHSELKQNGIRVALGRLLEFLDAHCVTFTTAEARREKQRSRKKRY